MNAVNNALRRLAELALLVGLVLFIVFAFRTLGAPEGADQTSQQPGQAELTPEIAAGTPYVAPYQDLSQPTPVVVILGTPEPTPTPWESDGSMAYPEPPPAPTFTPFPSPTLRPGATDTPLPLVEAAQDASGVIRYLVTDETGSASLVSLPVDALGMAKGASEQIVLNAEIPPDQGTIPSPDGRYLAILSYGEGGFAGRLVETATGGLYPFFETIAMGVFYDWHPDNERILMRSHTGSLWLANPISGDLTAIVIPDYGSIYGGAVSPDGKQVVYSYDRGLDSPGVQVRIVNSDGRDDHLIVESNGVYFAWSPDGKRIAFQGDGVVVMNADGSDVRKLIDIGLPGCDVNPLFWSPDSTHLAIVSSSNGYESCVGSEAASKNFDIYLVDVESGEAGQLLKDGISGNYDPS